MALVNQHHLSVAAARDAEAVSRSREEELSKQLSGGEHGGGGGPDHLTRSGSDFVKNDTERDIVRELRRSPSLVQSIAGGFLWTTSRPTNRRKTTTRLCEHSP